MTPKQVTPVAVCTRCGKFAYNAKSINQQCSERYDRKRCKVCLVAHFRMMIGLNVLPALPLDAGMADRAMTVVVVAGAMSASND
jgi:hypothetical protein